MGGEGGEGGFAVRTHEHNGFYCAVAGKYPREAGVGVACCTRVSTEVYAVPVIVPDMVLVRPGLCLGGRRRGASAGGRPTGYDVLTVV